MDRYNDECCSEEVDFSEENETIIGDYSINILPKIDFSKDDSKLINHFLQFSFAKKLFNV